MQSRAFHGTAGTVEQVHGQMSIQKRVDATSIRFHGPVRDPRDRQQLLAVLPASGRANESMGHGLLWPFPVSRTNQFIDPYKMLLRHQ